MESLHLDYTFYWVWFLFFVRCSGMFYSMPGIGTEQVPESMRLMPAIMVSLAMAFGGGHAAVPANIAQTAVMVGSEFILGWLFGIVPSLTLGGLSVAGQVIAGAIGLSQASMIDRSLGESISVISRLKMQLATLFFLSMDGHHIVIRALAGSTSDVGMGMFRPDMDTFNILLERFVQTFHLALVVAAPIIVSGLLTQFVLGLVTKFVPQINVFMISMPLSILAGLYIIMATFEGLIHHSALDLSDMEGTLQHFIAAQPKIESKPDDHFFTRQPLKPIAGLSR